MLASEDNDLAMLLYRLRLVRDSDKMDIVSESLNTVLDKIIDDVNSRGERHTAVIKGVDQFWDVSLSKFTQELMSKSAYFSQLPDMVENSAIGMNSRGFPVVTRDRTGIPIAARKEIELLFKLFEKGVKPTPIYLTTAFIKYSDIFKIIEIPYQRAFMIVYSYPSSVFLRSYFFPGKFAFSVRIKEEDKNRFINILKEKIGSNWENVFDSKNILDINPDTVKLEIMKRE